MHKLFALAFWLGFSASLLAQANEGEKPMLQPFQYQQALVEEAAQSIFIGQSGNDNQARLDLVGDQLIGILQQGDLNLLNFSIGGGSNRATAHQQGSNNELELVLNGDGNEINLSQEGNSNKVTQHLQSVNNLSIGITQIGDGHEVIQEGFGVSDQPITILQQGTPMQVTITTNGGN